MTLPFITYREPDKNGNLEYYVLQRDFPHWVGRISTIPKEGALAQSTIAGYNMYVIIEGTLRFGLIPTYKNVMEEMQLVADTMAVWYYTDRMIMDKKRYEKFKIKTNATISEQ